MSDEPIEPTTVALSSERDDDDDDASQSGPAVPPMPAQPPSAGVPPQPPGPGSWWRTGGGGGGSAPAPSGGSGWNSGGSGGGSAPAPSGGGSGWGGGSAPAPSGGGSGWGGGGGAATMTAPAWSPPATYIAAQYIVQAPPAPPVPAPPRFDIRVVRPVRNGIALIIGGVVAETFWNKLLHVAGDSWGVIVAFLAASAVLEWCYHDHRKLRWLVRVHTCSWVAAGLITPAGLLGLAWIGTGA
ncbi:hypothetical protein ACIQF6_33945 [Kitasatospora sp. NPDC092948]|uniref:hypothetical protein n=1 Tax=Kitasatospora sp. NPDC092948 TaxID=3364088 RepID=UPI00381BDF27